ncbi:MAG: carboxypeptidase-like regulatory domain-containing protein [Verrucomicrobia bacterium]|jgi:hypothetical protein|nr:carboxypeptidase-like regulatory domain-containing protein [Verrucomicrobiota bacterium]
MRSKFLIVVALGLVALGIALYYGGFRAKKQQATPTVVSTNETSQSSPESDSGLARPQATAAAAKPPPTALDIARAKAQAEVEAAIAANPDPEYARYYLGQISRDITFDWKQPINFYGKVVDEDGVPLEGATASFEWTTLSATGTANAVRTSDAQGLFALEGETGKRLSIQVGKEGYYSPAFARLASYEYASPFEGRFVPDPRRPVVFTLRKKGPGTELVTSQRGMKKYFAVALPLDDTPLQVDLLARQSGQGPLILRQTKPAYADWKQAESWSFRMEIPDGGFVEHKDEFPFEAPANGYQAVVRFELQKGQSNWTTKVKRDYYIRFGSPPRYGRLQVETDVSRDTVGLRYAINPDGSRYLESR